MAIGDNFLKKYSAKQIYLNLPKLAEVKHISEKILIPENLHWHIFERNIKQKYIFAHSKIINLQFSIWYGYHMNLEVRGGELGQASLKGVQMSFEYIYIAMGRGNIRPIFLHSINWGLGVTFLKAMK